MLLVALMIELTVRGIISMEVVLLATMVTLMLTWDSLKMNMVWAVFLKRTCIWECLHMDTINIKANLLISMQEQVQDKIMIAETL